MPDVYSLSNFYQGMKEVGLRLGYEFQVTVPEVDEVIQFLGTSTTLPGKTINVVDVPYFGQNFKIPTNAEYGGEWSITCRCDTDLKLKKSIEKWMNKYSDLSQNGGGMKNVPDLNVRIDLLAHDLKTITDTYILVGCFPTSMGELGLDQSAADPVTIDLGLAFQYWFNEADQDPLG